MPKRSKNLKKSSLNKKVLLAVLGATILVGAFILLEATNTTHFLHKQTAQSDTTVTASAGTKGVPSSSSSSPGAVQTTDQNSQEQVKQQNANTGAALVAPTGTFANIYKNVSVDDNMQSTCNTTPGATCQITFIKGSVTKSLPIKTTDGGGAVYWSWKPSDVGLTSGSWHITATAKLGSQTQTSDNGSLELEIN